MADLHDRAIELRRQGWSVNDIAREVGVAKSTAWLWVRHLPLDPDTEHARRKRAHAKLMADARWAEHRAARTARQAEIRAGAAVEVGSLSGRELLLLGAVAYWCEGSKAKPWRPGEERLGFINSDPMLVELFLRFLESLGRPRSELRYRVSIHDTSDPAAAERWWAQRLRLPAACFQRSTLKRHSVRTTRRNTADDYHGCLIVRVPRSRELYWRIEGLIWGLGGEGPAETR